MNATSAQPSPRGERIRVMHFIHTIAYGGVETNILNWLRSLDADRFEIHLACFDHPGGGGTEEPFVRAAEGFGFAVDRIPWARRKPFFKAARVLRKILIDRGIRILHTHNCYANVVGWLASRRLPVKTITTAYVWSKFNWRRDLIQALDIQVTRWFDRQTAHCEETRRSMERYGFPPERVKTLICGFESARVDLDPAERERRRRERGIEPGQIVLANVARFYPEKVHDSLLRIFRDVNGRCPETRLWIYGVGPLEEQTRALSTELGMDSIVTFKGFAGDLAAELALVDMQVHPSKMEGVPLAICSGMAAGLPIVASNVGGISEVLHHDRTGWLIPRGDETAFADAVLHLIRNPGEAARLGAGARRFIENDYSLAAAARAVEDTYIEMLQPCG